MIKKPLIERLRDLLAVLAACCIGVHASAASPPSVDWREQIIYFVMLDRFADGDPSNNDQGKGEFDPVDGRKFSGGDLAGVRARLAYIQGLGATTLWITPPVRNQWWNVRDQFGGYHGYWGIDFKNVDPHFGSLADYRALADDLHGRGMFLIQDIVVNHTANYRELSSSGAVTRVADSEGLVAPLQKPFSGNLNPSLYHRGGVITDFNDQSQLLAGELAGLDDFNTSSPLIRRALRDSYNYWIREVGVDGFRVDTAFYVPPAYFRDFLWSSDRVAPGVMRTAQASGRPNFLVFGEGFAMDAPFERTQSRRIDEYMRDAATGQRYLPSMINFPFYASSLQVFALGAPTSVLADRIVEQSSVFESPGLLPTFVDNHDVDRYMAGASADALRQALVAMFTLPGIPTIYYGTEQSFKGQRDSMFAAGYGSGGVDHFAANSSMYGFIASMASLRKSHRVLTHGAPQWLLRDPSGPGLLAYRMRLKGERDVLVLMNTSTNPRLFGYFEDDAYGLWHNLPGGPSQVFQKGIGMTVPGKAFYVLEASASGETEFVSVRAPLFIETPQSSGIVTGTVNLQGSGPATSLIVDGVVDHAIPVVSDGRVWSAALDTRDMVEPALTHTVVAYDAKTRTVSPPWVFNAANPWSSRGSSHDPIGDDRGRSGALTYPAGRDWEGVHAGDIEKVEVFTSGARLRVDVTMKEISRAWNPANGFDHVSFQLFLDVPGVAGSASAMPLQNSPLPSAMTWNRRLRAHGWSNALFSPGDGEGIALPSAAKIAVDVQRRVISFEFSPESLGYPATLDGLRVYLNTWDYDGGLRPLLEVQTPGAFGGRRNAEDVLLMDEVAPIVVQ